MLMSVVPSTGGLHTVHACHIATPSLPECWAANSTSEHDDICTVLAVMVTATKPIMIDGMTAKKDMLFLEKVIE